MRCIIAKTQKEILDNLHVRQTVFVKDLEIPFYIETDEFDETARLFVAYNQENIPVGAGRFRIIDNYGKIERVCVLKEYRKQGYGKLIVNTIEEYARKHEHLEEIHLNAQLAAFPFYTSIGYKPFGEMFFEIGIEHKHMKKVL